MDPQPDEEIPKARYGGWRESFLPLPVYPSPQISILLVSMEVLLHRQGRLNLGPLATELLGHPLSSRSGWGWGVGRTESAKTLIRR